MKNDQSTKVSVSDPLTRDAEFFRHGTDPIPPAPTTEKEISAREVASGAAPVVTRVEPAHVGPTRVAGPNVHVEPSDVIAPDGRPTERRNGVTFICGTDIVVGGPSQQ